MDPSRPALRRLAYPLVAGLTLAVIQAGPAHATSKPEQKAKGKPAGAAAPAAQPKPDLAALRQRLKEARGAKAAQRTGKPGPALQVPPLRGPADLPDAFPWQWL
jgi:hypothetical protein